MDYLEDDIKNLENKYNAYLKKTTGYLDPISRIKINLLCNRFVFMLNYFKMNGRDRADTDLLFGRLIENANEIFRIIDKAIEGKNNSDNSR